MLVGESPYSSGAQLRKLVTRPMPSASGPGARLALVIGNAAYPEADPPLAQPRNDAQLLTDELKNAGFQVDLVENVTKQQLKDAVDRFKAKVKPGAAALLYYGGYGIQSGRQNYMIPVNAQIWSERDVARDGISIEAVLAEVPDNGMAVKLVIFDAAHQPQLKDIATVTRHPQFDLATLLAHRATADVALLKLAAALPPAQSQRRGGPHRVARSRRAGGSSATGTTASGSSRPGSRPDRAGSRSPAGTPTPGTPGRCG